MKKAQKADRRHKTRGRPAPGRRPDLLEELARHLNFRRDPKSPAALQDVGLEAEEVVEAITDPLTRRRWLEPPPSPFGVALRVLARVPVSLATAATMTGPHADILEAVRRFNRFARTAPMHVKITVIKRGPRLEFQSGADPAGAETAQRRLVWMLWRAFFMEGGWRRLKRCQACDRWIAVRSRKRRWCADRCRDKARYPKVKARRRAARNRDG